MPLEAEPAEHSRKHMHARPQDLLPARGPRHRRWRQTRANVRMIFDCFYFDVLLMCVAISCPAQPSAPTNGAVSCTLPTAHGSTCTPSCNNGYAISGSYTCSLGSFTGSPSCVGTLIVQQPCRVNPQRRHALRSRRSRRGPPRARCRLAPPRRQPRSPVPMASASAAAAAPQRRRATRALARGWAPARGRRPRQ